MKNLWLFFVVGLSTGFISEKLIVLSQSPGDDLYLDHYDTGSGYLPVDDEDGEDDGSGSGSGSGDYGFLSNQGDVLRFLNISLPAQPTADAAPNLPTTAADDTVTHSPDDSNLLDEFSDPTSNDILTTTNGDVTTDSAVNDEVIKKDQVFVVESGVIPKRGRNSWQKDHDIPKEVTSENLWERSEILAAVIACGVVLFICAVSLLILLAYRMKKKDEGSYDLADTKMSATAYHKAPTKEFFA